MLNDLLIYAVIGGAVVYGILCAIFRDKAISWIGSIIVGALVIYFVFPEPKSAKTLGDIANNMSLLIYKVVYFVGWLAGSFAVSFLCGRKP